MMWFSDQFSSKYSFSIYYNCFHKTTYILQEDLTTLLYKLKSLFVFGTVLATQSGSIGEVNKEFYVIFIRFP